MPVTHPFVNPQPDGADATVTRPSDWNAAHTVSIDNADVANAAAIVESKLSLNFATHAAVTVADTTSIDMSISGQQISAAAIFGTTSTTIAQGDHTHAQLHDAVTLDTNADTLLSLSTQALGLDTQLANKVFAGATSGGAAIPAFRSLVAADIPALSYVDGSGVAGQVTEWVDSNTIQAAKIIGPAVNILTLTNAAASTLALNITAAKTLTLTSADNYNLTIPATGVVDLLGVAQTISATKTFTTQQIIDGTSNVIQLIIDGHSTQTSDIQAWRKSDGTVLAAVQGRGTFYANLGGLASNNFMGLNAGNATASGGNNQGIGENSLKAVTTGAFNNAIGWNTLQANTIGGDNNAMGAQALQGNTEGSGNNAMGRTVLLANTTGSNNTGVGTFALQTNISGSSNVAIGTAALSVSTGSDNISFGVSSSRWLENGANNLTIGSLAGFSNTGGSGNVIIGYKAGYSETLSNKLHIGNTPTGTSLIAGDFLAQTLRLQGDVDIANNGTLGSEKVTNGNFSTNPDVTWTFGAGWTHNVVNFRADRVASAVTTLSQTIGMVAGETYLLTCIIVRTAGKMSIDCGGTSVASGINNSAVHWFTFKATTTGNLIFTPDASFAGYVDSVTVKRIEGGNLIVTNALSGNPYGLTTGDLLWGSDTKTNMLFLDSSANAIGINQATPTAYLHLGAGSTAANTAPLKFTQDATSLLTAVEAGAMEYYHNSLWFTNLAVRRTVVQAQSVVLVDQTIANSTVETTIFTQAHGANYLQVGKCEEITIQGIISSLNTGLPAANALTIRVKYAGATLGTFTVLKSATANRNYEIHVRITCRAIGSGTTTIQVHCNADVEGIATDPVFNGTSTGLDSTTAQATTVTVQWTDASASNTTTIQQGYALSIDNNA